MNLELAESVPSCSRLILMSQPKLPLMQWQWWELNRDETAEATDAALTNFKVFHQKQWLKKKKYNNI